MSVRNFIFGGWIGNSGGNERRARKKPPSLETDMRKWDGTVNDKHVLLINFDTYYNVSGGLKRESAIATVNAMGSDEAYTKIPRLTQ
jgi:hypothetical protein